VYLLRTRDSPGPNDYLDALRARRATVVVAEDVRRMRHSQIVALALGLSLIFAVALVFDVGGKVRIGGGGAAPRGTLPAAAAITGAFIGGAAAAVASYLADKRRFEREDKYRDYGERRQVYTEFALRWFQYDEDKGRTHSNLQGRQEREEAYLDLLRTYNVLSIIAPEEVRGAALDLREWIKLNKEDRDRDPYVPGRYWTVVRKDLGKPPR